MYKTSNLKTFVKYLGLLQKHPYQKWLKHSNVRTFHQNDRNPVFNIMYPEIVQDLLSNGIQVSEVKDHLQKVIQYNILNRNDYSIYSVLTMYNMLTPLEQQTSDNQRLANILDWCIELGVTSCIMADDILDGTELRWNQKCWYKVDIGKDVINDICLLHSAVYKLIHKHFCNQPYRDQLLHIFSKFSYCYYLGQTLDNSISGTFKKNRDISGFTMDKYLACSNYKTAIAFYTTPAHAAMILANISYEPIDGVLQKLGYLYQIQNDTKDCFGKLSNYGTDIREGKLTWLIAKALQISSSLQFKMFEDNYGKNDIECVKIVLQVFEELNMLQQYKICNQTLIEDAKSHINKIPHEGFRKVLHLCVDTHIKNDSEFLGV